MKKLTAVCALVLALTMALAPDMLPIWQTGK